MRYLGYQARKRLLCRLASIAGTASTGLFLNALLDPAVLFVSIPWQERVRASP